MPTAATPNPTPRPMLSLRCIDSQWFAVLVVQVPGVPHAASPLLLAEAQRPVKIAPTTSPAAPTPNETHAVPGMPREGVSVDGGGDADAVAVAETAALLAGCPLADAEAAPAPARFSTTRTTRSFSAIRTTTVLSRLSYPSAWKVN